MNELSQRKQTPWDFPPPPPQKQRRKKGCGCFSALLAMLLVAALALVGFGLLENTVSPQTQSLLPTLPSASAAAQTGTPRTTRLETTAAMPAEGRLRAHYETLSKAGQRAYDTILAALPGFPESIEIPKLNDDDISDVFYALLRDQPLLFQLSSESMTRSSGNKVWFCPVYRMNQPTYEKQLREVAGVCAELAALVPAGASDYEAELILHDALIRRCTYRYTGAAEENTVYGALVEGVAACEGYSRAMLLLLEQQGIAGCVVTGDATNSMGETSKHAWNKVRIDGDWYQLDATWDDPVSEDGGAETLVHSYFNLTDAELGMSHELTRDSRPCTATKANYFVVQGVLFAQVDKAAEDVLARALTEAINRGADLLEFRCKDKTGYEAAIKRLFDEQKIYRILSKADLATGKKISSQRVSYTEIPALHILQVIPVIKG
ncbi:MAG: hypothetical protein LBC83_08175 [Oscillospiraceae bacterium]|jgi:transglutaminase-like putative cysteine protease|nr:hypothetical protein [Oscillospiraceae bacterium]